jgi:hypothetical protein
MIQNSQDTGLQTKDVNRMIDFMVSFWMVEDSVLGKHLLTLVVVDNTSLNEVLTGFAMRQVLRKCQVLIYCIVILIF